MKLVLDLEDSRGARAYSKEQSFWNAQIEEMTRLLQEHRSSVAGFRGGTSASTHRDRPFGNRDAPNLALAILGGRGSGKSSLLRTLVDRLEKQDPTFYVLPPVDPTLLSQHDNFLHAFLALLLEEIEGHAERKSRALHELTCRHALQKLADHLWAVNGAPPREEDPVAAGLEHLDRHRSGPLLQSRLASFLDHVAHDLSRMLKENEVGTGSGTIMVLPVDDPDMAFDHFTHTLEIYRRYLRHPNLVPIFAFSRELALELLTLHFGHHFGYEKKRIGDQDAFRPRIEELANQFLDKFLHPRSRITLELPQNQLLEATLLRRRATDGPNDPGGDETGVTEVRDLLRRACRRLFGEPGLMESILPGSLRRVLQLLDTLHRKSEETTPTDDATGDELRALLDTANAVIQVHYPALGRRGIDTEKIYGAPLEDRGSMLLRMISEAPREFRSPAWNQMELDDLLLSVLALMAHRPPGGHGTRREGDDGTKQDDAEAKQDDAEAKQATREHALHTTLWLLRLLFGFYLPLRLGRARGGPPPPRGWNPVTTPRKLLLALDPHAETFPGVLFVHPGGAVRLGRTGGDQNDAAFYPLAFANPLYEEAWRGYSIWPWIEVCEDNLARKAELRRLDLLPGLAGLLPMLQHRDRARLLVWCFFGSEPAPWAAISLWRGLSLLARILEGSKSVAALLEEHLRGAVVDERLAAPPPAVVGLGRLDPWGGRIPREELASFAQKLEKWSEEFTVEPRERHRLVELLHGHAIETRLLAPLASLESRLPFHRWGAGTVLREWLGTLGGYAAEVGMGEAFESCPLVWPFLTDTPGEWPLEVDVTGRDAEDEDTDSDIGARGTESVKLDHRLTPAQVLDVLVPADYPRYFATLRHALGETELDPAQLL